MAEPLAEEKKQEWRDKFQKQRESGLSIKHWCRNNHITTQSFYYWRVRLFPEPTLSHSQFKEITDSKDVGIYIEYKGIHIHIDKHFDPATLKKCLSALKEIPC
jgi:hypothetical protein